MKTVVPDAEVILMEAAGPGAGQRLSSAGQTVVIHRASNQAIIGIDGHTAFWDELVEVHWAGSHLPKLEGIGQVEIRDREGLTLELLPMNGYRDRYETNGETVFFLTDAE
jgi:hypothetical protein